MPSWNFRATVAPINCPHRRPDVTLAHPVGVEAHTHEAVHQPVCIGRNGWVGRARRRADVGHASRGEPGRAWLRTICACPGASGRATDGTFAATFADPLANADADPFAAAPRGADRWPGGALGALDRTRVRV